MLEGELTKAGQIVASAGNDEFFVMLPETHPGVAASVADTMRRGVETLGIPHPTSALVSISVSAATAFPYRMSDPTAVVESLDKAIVDAQGRGGNRVVTIPLVGA